MSKRAGLFNRIPIKKPGKSVFDLSHEKKLSFNMGELIPIMVMDTVPGDVFQANSEVMMRLAPLISPMMHRVNAYIHYFFVPNRIIWTSDNLGGKGWEDFITGGEDGTLEPTFPTRTADNAAKGYYYSGKLADYMGYPITDSGMTVSQSLEVNLLPFRAYQNIYNEYYRDQNVTPAVAVSTGSTGTNVDLGIRTRAWERDYFQSCIPWAQRGGDVNLPVEGDITFVPEYLDPSLFVTTTGPAGDQDIVRNSSEEMKDSTSGETGYVQNLTASKVYDLDNVSITINELRTSVALQRWLENNARAGGRYIEQILVHFGVVSSNKSLQRPQYISGAKFPVTISEVLKTNYDSTTTEDVGTMYGHGLSVGSTPKFKYFCEEHGWIMAILSVIPRSAYFQGVPRWNWKTDKTEYYTPEFANLGEQAVYAGELFYDWEGTAGDWDDTFGYQSRFAEYKFIQDSCHGEFKSSLMHWHLAREFASEPSLNTAFTECDHTADDLHRVFAVDSSGYDKLYAQVYHNIRALRPMPKFGIPKL